jgi:hypothetical protein
MTAAYACAPACWAADTTRPRSEATEQKADLD